MNDARPLTCLSKLPAEHHRDAEAIAANLGSGPLGVAFSGGVDSAVLLAVAHQTLGDAKVLGILAVSPSLASFERDTARGVAQQIGARLAEIETNELEVAAYASNPVNRCYFCKDEMFSRIDAKFMNRHGLIAIAYGENADDARRIDRPGALAADRHHVLRPLAAAGLDKARVRRLAHGLGLTVADKPAAPCLASRLPHGHPVTLHKLKAIETAEEALRELGFSDSRVRHHGETARIELPTAELSLATSPHVREQIVARVAAAGFRHVTIDPLGIQSGAFTLQVLKRHG